MALKLRDGWDGLTQLFESLLCLTMPLASARHPNYPRRYAALLPATIPLFLALAYGAIDIDRGLREARHMVAGSVASSGLGCALVWALYPADGRYAGPVSGVFTVLAFLLSIAWLNLVGGQLVSACILLGALFISY